jgi:hypothetical protein
MAMATTSATKVKMGMIVDSCVDNDDAGERRTTT